MSTTSDGQLPALRGAIVIGGSMAGLTAAQVLSNHFDNVTILERDTFPEGAGSRKGVPQARHIHATCDVGLVEKGLCCLLIVADQILEILDLVA